MPRKYPHSSTLAGRKDWVKEMGKEIVIPTVPASATASALSSDQAVTAALNHSKRVIYVDGPIDHIDLTPQTSSTDLRYLVFRPGGSIRTFGNVMGSNWRITTEDPDHVWTMEKGSGFHTRCKFINARNVWGERVYYEGGQVNGGALAVWDNTAGNESLDCGWQWIYHNNSDASEAYRDFVLFGCNGYSNPKRALRSRQGFIYNARSRNAGDFFQITNGRPQDNWNNGVSHPSFHIAGVDAWTDLYNAYGECVVTENFLDNKGGSKESGNPVVTEDCRCFGYRRGVHFYKSSNAGGGSVNDPGVAIGAAHWGHADNLHYKDIVIWDSTVGISLQPGYNLGYPAENIDLSHILIHGADKVPWNQPLADIGKEQQEGIALLANDAGAGGHDFTGLHMVDCGSVFNIDDAGFALRNSVITNCQSGAAIGNAQSSNNKSNLAFRGASTADSAGRLARSQTMAIEMPDPDNILSDIGIMHYLPHALLDPADAPDNDFIWLIGNEAAPGATSEPVVRASLTPAPESVLTGITQTFTLDRGDEVFENWSLEVGTDADVSAYYYDTNPVTGDTITVDGLPSDGSVVRVAFWFRRPGAASAQSRVYYYTASSASLNDLAIVSRTVEVAPGGTVAVPLAPLVDIPAGRVISVLPLNQPAQGAMAIHQNGAEVRYQAPMTPGTYVAAIGLDDPDSDAPIPRANIRFRVKQDPQYTADIYREMTLGETGGGTFPVVRPIVIEARNLGATAIVQTLDIGTGNYAYVTPNVGQHLHRVPLTLSGGETAYLMCVARQAADPTIIAPPAQTVQIGSTHSLDVASLIHDPYLRSVPLSITDEVGGDATINDGVLTFVGSTVGAASVELLIGDVVFTVDYTVTGHTADLIMSDTEVVCNAGDVTVDLAALVTGSVDSFGIKTRDGEIFGTARVIDGVLYFEPADDYAGTQSLVVYARDSATAEQIHAIVTVIVAPPETTTNGRLVQAHGLDLTNGSIRPDTAITNTGTGLVISWCGRRKANGRARLAASNGAVLMSLTEAGVFTAPTNCRLSTELSTLSPGQGTAPTGWHTYTLEIPATITSSIDSLLQNWGEIAWLKVERGNVQQHYWSASIGAGDRLYDYYDDNDADIVGGDWIRQDEHHENLFNGYQLASDGNTTLMLPNREGGGYGGLLPAGFTAGLYVAPKIDADGYASFNGCETSVLMSRSPLIAALAAPLIMDSKPTITDVAALPTLSANKRRLMLTSGELVLLEQPL